MKKILFTILSILLITSSCFGANKAIQWDTLLGGLQDDAGLPAVDWTVTVYENDGTSTTSTIWEDASKTTTAANPITLDEYGTKERYFDGIYRIVVKDADGVTIRDTDDVRIIGYVDFGGLYIDVYSTYGNSATDIQTAINETAASGGGTLLFKNETFTIASNVVGSSNVSWKVQQGAVFNIAGSYIVSPNEYVEVGNYQFIYGTGSFVFKSDVNPIQYDIWTGVSGGRTIIKNDLKIEGSLHLTNGIKYITKDFMNIKKWSNENNDYSGKNYSKSYIYGIVNLSNNYGSYNETGTNRITYNPLNNFLYTTPLSATDDDKFQAIDIADSVTSNMVSLNSKPIGISGSEYIPIINSICFFDFFTDHVTILNCDTNIVTTINIADSAVPRSGIFNPLNNLLYISDTNSDKIFVVSVTSNSTITSINTNSSSMGKIEYNPSNNFIYGIDISTDKIYIYNCDTNSFVSSINVSGLEHPFDITYNDYNNSMYVSFIEANKTAIAIIDCNTNLFTTTIPIISATRTANAIVYNPINHYIYYMDRGNDLIKVYDSDNNLIDQIDCTYNIDSFMFVPYNNTIYGLDTYNNLLVKIGFY